MAAEEGWGVCPTAARRRGRKGRHKRRVKREQKTALARHLQRLPSRDALETLESERGDGVSDGCPEARP